MPADPVTSRRRPGGRRRLAAALLVACSALTAGAGATSLALFTSSDTATGGFTTGTIVLTDSPSTLFAVPAMMPGDTTNATLTVSNGGTAELRYAMTSSSTNTDGKALRSVLSVTIKTVGTSCAAFDGTTLYSGLLGASTAAFGDPATGAQTGDRTLSAGSSEQLCFRVSLPSSTGDAYQGATTTATFTFTAEQTANT